MNNKVVLAMIAPGAAGKTTLRRMLTNQDAGAEKHFGMHDCFYSNHSSCCGLKFKTKDEVLDRLHSPVAEGVEPVNHQPERGAYVPYKVGWTTFANGPAVCGLNGKDGHPGRVQTRTANIDAINYAVDKGLEVSDFVIFDGVMSSKRLVAHLATHPYRRMRGLEDRYRACEGSGQAD